MKNLDKAADDERATAKKLHCYRARLRLYYQHLSQHKQLLTEQIARKDRSKDSLAYQAMITKAALSAASMKHSVTQRQVAREQGLHQAVDEVPLVPILTTSVAGESNRGLGLVAQSSVSSHSSSFSAMPSPIRRGVSSSPIRAAAATAAAIGPSSPTAMSPTTGRKSFKKSVRLDDGQGLGSDEGQGLVLGMSPVTLYDELSRSGKAKKEREDGGSVLSSSGKEGTGMQRQPSLSTVVEAEEKVGMGEGEGRSSSSSRGSPLTTPGMSGHNYLPPESFSSSMVSSVDQSYMPGNTQHV